MPFPTREPPAERRSAHRESVTASRPNLFFVGLMGAGKTTVGRTVARRIGYSFFDSDHEIEARCGVRIPVIFDHEGESGFRDREAQMIDELTQRQGIVLATGGGAVLRPENRSRLKARGTVVYLRASPHDLWLRTRHDRNRPLLQTQDPKGRLEALYAERDPLYREVADFVIETGKPSVAQLANMVLMQLEMSGWIAAVAGGSEAHPHTDADAGANANADANADAEPSQDAKTDDHA
ncbi:shikimate kinase AroK [Cupriavidus gilardii]|uniref:shikimate kinase AroK n=1 Tax=Cupriavidus gilardii TaxID=82541 RepID=UPI00352DC04E